MRKLCVVLISVITLAPGAEKTGLNHISADSLRGNLSFLASDELEGRGTPSRGLDLAADFIAARFRSAGLESAVPGGGYFQEAKFEQSSINMDGFRLAIKSGERELDVKGPEVRLRSDVAIDRVGAPVVKLPPNGAIPPVTGLIVAGDERRYGAEILLNELQARKPALILLIGKTRKNAQPGPAAQRAAPTAALTETEAPHAPVIRIRRSDVAAMLNEGGELTVSLHVEDPVRKHVILRNVAAILRGSDPQLRDQYLLITAHYDHLGKTDKGTYNGANDNGSGTVSVIEIASALASLETHPKRSILFVALFGEEEGLLGAYYYAHHPLVPLKSTVANINLEQMGRTDDPGGKEVGAFGFTGPSYSNVPAIMAEAAKAEGVTVYRRKDADDFFDRSDNYAFALYGVIAHTIAVAFEYPDYHGLGDKWEKIDYANMARIDRGVAAGVIQLANEPDAPKWSDARGAGVYREAGAK